MRSQIQNLLAILLLSYLVTTVTVVLVKNRSEILSTFERTVGGIFSITISPTLIYSSPNLSDWNYNSECNPGGDTSCTCGNSDSLLKSYSSYAEVISNSNKRNTWSNAIAAKKFQETLPDGTPVRKGVYIYTIESKLPIIPDTELLHQQKPEAAMMVMFYYDGRNPDGKFSLEAAISWQLNPWGDNRGEISVCGENYNCFTGNGYYTGFNLWDTDWHRFKLAADYTPSKFLYIEIDGVRVDLNNVKLLKIDRPDWGGDKSFFFSAESLSSYPQPNCDYVFYWNQLYRNVKMEVSNLESTTTTTSTSSTSTSTSSTSSSTSSSTTTSSTMTTSSTTTSTSSTSTTSSTTSTTTTSTTTTSSTTTTTIPRTFKVSSFTCSAITGGHNCVIAYTNNLGENTVVVFLFADSQGKVIQAPAPIVGTNSGTASVVLYCSSVTAGTYSVKWRAYRQSDTLLLNSVAWSPSSQSVTC